MLEAGSGNEQSREPGSEAKEMSEAEFVVLIFFLLVLVCLAAYVLWHLHRKRSGGLEGASGVNSAQGLCGRPMPSCGAIAEAQGSL